MEGGGPKPETRNSKQEIRNQKHNSSTSPRILKGLSPQNPIPRRLSCVLKGLSLQNPSTINRNENMVWTDSQDYGADEILYIT